MRPGKAGQREWEVARPSCNFVRRPAGATPAGLRVRPPKPVARLATVSARGSAKRRHARVWARGQAAPHPIPARMPRGLHALKALTASPSGGRGGGRLRRGVRPGPARRGRPRPRGGPRLSSPQPGFAESRCVVADARRVRRRTGRRPPGTAPAPASRSATGQGNRSRGGWGQGVGGRQTSGAVGEPRGHWPRPSPGGPGGGALQEGSRAHAQTWADMSPGRVQGVARAQRAPAGRVNSRAHLLAVPARERASRRQRAAAAVGVDGSTQEQDGQSVDGSLWRLLGQCVPVGGRDGAPRGEPELGPAQGSVLSPWLGHVSWHEVRDQWCATAVPKAFLPAPQERASGAPQRHPPAIRPLGCARTRPARGGYTLRAPRSQGWSGAALLVLGLDTRRRMGEGRTIRGALERRLREGQPGETRALLGMPSRRRGEVHRP